jgi:hypothetical protein
MAFGMWKHICAQCTISTSNKRAERKREGGVGGWGLGLDGGAIGKPGPWAWVRTRRARGDPATRGTGDGLRTKDLRPKKLSSKK